jgi:hypothetical protein
MSYKKSTGNTGFAAFYNVSIKCESVISRTVREGKTVIEVTVERGLVVPYCFVQAS